MRADIFALGVTLHVLLTNYDVAQNLWNFPPVTTLNADVSRRMEEVIGRATQVKVEKRYTSVAELRAALLRCRGGKQIAQHLPTAGLIGASVATQ